MAVGEEVSKYFLMAMGKRGCNTGNNVQKECVAETTQIE